MELKINADKIVEIIIEKDVIVFLTESKTLIIMLPNSNKEFMKYLKEKMKEKDRKV